MKKFFSIILVLILTQCSLNKVVLHHGVHNLEKKQTKLKINYSNKNDIITLIGPPSTKSTFDTDIYIYIEKKTSSSKLMKLGKKKLLASNVLVLEINEDGILVDKKFYNMEDMKKFLLMKISPQLIIQKIIYIQFLIIIKTKN